MKNTIQVTVSVQGRKEGQRAMGNCHNVLVDAVSTKEKPRPFHINSTMRRNWSERDTPFRIMNEWAEIFTGAKHLDCSGRVLKRQCVRVKC